MARMVDVALCMGGNHHAETHGKQRNVLPHSDDVICNLHNSRKITQIWADTKIN